MNIYYRKADGWPDAPAGAEITADLDKTLAIFRNLQPSGGFMGIILDERFILHISPRKKGGITVELTDTTTPDMDLTTATAEFAESLIRAADEGKNVMRLAKVSEYQWRYIKLKHEPGEYEAMVSDLPDPSPRVIPNVVVDPSKIVSYPMAMIKSGHERIGGIWVSIGFHSPEREHDVLHIVGGEETNLPRKKLGLIPIYLERYDQMLSCYQGADLIKIANDSVIVILNQTGQNKLGLPGDLLFSTDPSNPNFQAAKAIFEKMKQFESGKIIKFA